MIMLFAIKWEALVRIHQDGYELFRRAVVDRDADAWAEISVSYRAMMVAWARRCHVADLSGECYEDLADEALARAWKALSPERFAQFPNLAALLGYLRTCVMAAAIDAARARTSYERMAERMEHSASAAPDQLVLEQLDRTELWQLANSLVASEAERVVLLERYVLDLPPRVIQSRHPGLFPDVRRIYETIRNICDRLRRNQDVRRAYAEHLAA
jgi:DNA-directed RNA polymerase specialized sigma24 family protein